MSAQAPEPLIFPQDTNSIKDAQLFLFKQTAKAAPARVSGKIIYFKTWSEHHSEISCHIFGAELADPSCSHVWAKLFR